MKKVLALVLAVIMVCTMAMAVTVITPADVTVATSELPQVVESDADATYGIEIPSDYYNADLANKVVEASNVTLAKKGDKLYVVVPTLDKALDGVADFTFTGTLKVTDKNDSTTFYVYSIKDGKLQQTSGQVKGIPVSATALKAWNDAVTNKFVEKYDIGFATTVVDTDAKFEAAFNALSEADDYAAQWYVTGKKAVTFTDNNVTVTVPANTSFKMYRPTDAVVPAAAGAYAEGFRGLFVEGTGITMSLNVTPANNTMNLYAVDKNGKIYSLGTSLTESKKVDGTIVGTLSATFGGTYQIVKLNKAVDVNGTVPGVATAPTTPGTTTNPGTGANDVVGVAAALAVVALVSGAAISLKK